MNKCSVPGCHQGEAESQTGENQWSGLCHCPWSWSWSWSSPSHFSRMWTVSPRSRTRPWLTEPLKLQTTAERQRQEVDAGSEEVLQGASHWLSLAKGRGLAGRLPLLVNWMNRQSEAKSTNQDSSAPWWRPLTFATWPANSFLFEPCPFLLGGL